MKFTQSGNNFEILKTHLAKKKLTLNFEILHSGNGGIFEVLTVSDSITPILKVITCNILTFGFKGHYIYLFVETYDKWW